MTENTDLALQQAYDALAATYDSNRGQFDMGAVLDDFMTRLPARGDLLDLGCGAGEPFARAFLDQGWQVTGVDFSAQMLALAERYVPAMKRIRADMREVKFPGGSFDAVTAIYSLFHVPRSDHPELFARIRHWLKPGGRLLFTYATQDYSGQERFEGHKQFMGQALFYSHTTPAELQDQVSGAELRLESAREREIGGERFLWITAARDEVPTIERAS